MQITLQKCNLSFFPRIPNFSLQMVGLIAKVVLQLLQWCCCFAELVIEASQAMTTVCASLYTTEKFHLYSVSKKREIVLNVFVIT